MESEYKYCHVPVLHEYRPVIFQTSSKSRAHNAKVTQVE